MQISEKSKTIIDACRFCWMCRHICPIGNATGKECNTARARALSLSLVTRGAAELKGDIVDNVYECALCGGCTADCATGWDPVKFTKEARLAAALEGNMPAYVEKLLDNFDKTGNVYGITNKNTALGKAIGAHKDKEKILFWLGKDALCKTPDKAVKAISLLEKAGMSFSVLAKEPDSGYAYDFLIGASEETKNVMALAAKAIKDSGAETVVCYDPADAKIFLREYKEYGIALTAKVVTFPAFLAALIAKKAIKPKKALGALTFQDPASLARDLEDTDSARKILGACGDLREMLLHGKATMLAGNLIMSEYIPGVMKLVAENRVENAKNVSAETVVTASPAEYVALAGNASGAFNVITIEEAVLKCL